MDLISIFPALWTAGADTATGTTDLVPSVQDVVDTMGEEVKQTSSILSKIFQPILDKLPSLIFAVLFLLIGRFIFSAVSFGSGAPGGIFFPLLVIGGYIGGAFATISVQYFGLNPMYINNFVLLAMAGYFAAIVRAPLTGIILIFEMTGSLSQMLSLSVVSIVAYVVAILMKSKPIYESLLERLLQKRGESVTDETGEKVLANFVVKQGSSIEEELIRDVKWPDNCLLVAIQRGTDEIIPKGKTKLQAGDLIVTMTDERDMGVIHEKMEALCQERF